MDSSAARHRRIAGLQAKIMGGFAAVIAAVTLVFGGLQTLHNNEVRREVAAAEARADFWRVVDGKQAPTGGSFAANKLGADLRDLLDPEKAPGTELPEAFTNFAAGPSDYPDISEDLGFSPFNDSGLACSDCGPLNGYMLDQLRQIQTGQGQAVVNTELANAPEVQGLTLTPFGTNGYLWFGFLYAAGSVSALVIAIRKDSSRYDYPDRLLNWKNDGGSSADPYKRISHVLSPLYFVTVVPWRRKRGYDFRGVLKEINMTKLYDTVKSKLQTLDSLEPAERNKPETRLLREKLEQALEQIRQEVVAYDASAAPAEQTADDVRRGIELSLGEVFQELEIRASSRRELDEIPLPGDVPSLSERRRLREEPSEPKRQTSN